MFLYNTKFHLDLFYELSLGWFEPELIFQAAKVPTTNAKIEAKWIFLTNLIN